MRAFKSIFGVLLLLVGGFVLYKILPVYWGNYRLGREVEEQAINFTYTNKNEADIAVILVEKAHGFDVEITPEQVKVVRTPGDLSITVEYTAHVDLPFYPLDINFKDESKNHNVMKP
jgi:hypothetical protein